MNETECDNLIKSVKWTEPSNLISLAILEFINVLVIGGNLLVIAAVFCSNKLRSVTNFFIVNLAVADLLVGLAVLPFSATWEVFKVWIFGDVWCRIWLAVDVWMCTASILNLCAISLDRYVAVTRPVTYPSIMSTKKAKSLIAGIWVLSFVICFPPLVGWKDQKPMIQPTYTRGNYTLYYATSAATISSESSSTTTTTTSSSSALLGVVTSTTASSPSLKHKGKRQRKFLKPTANAPYTIPSFAAAAPVSVAKTLRHKRGALAKSSSSSLYNSFNPYDPYYAHLQNHNTGDKNVNKRVDAIVDTDDDNNKSNYNYNYHYSNEDADAENSNNIAGADDASATDLDDYDEYTLTTSDSSESSSIRYNNDPTSAMYYDTADSGRVMKNGAETPPTTTTYSAASSSMSSYATPPPPCPWKCELTNDRGYVLYSALGSFYIPMFVMLFFYWRIYRAAVRTTRAINQGFKTTKGSKGIGSRFDEQRLTLRIHRGRGSNQHDSTHSNGSTQSTTTTLGTPSPERLSKYSTRRQHNNHDKIKISVSYPSNDNISELAHGHDGIHLERGREHRASSASSGNMLFAVHYGSHNGRDCNETQLYRHQHQHDSNCYLQVGKNMPDMLRRTSNTSEHQQNRPNKKMGKRNIKAQVKRFRMETKAAKTLAIIVGLFIFCWLPFFTMYIIRPFCEDCIDPLLFSVLFWLGYCNSAVNPMIYALFSKDFRFAFKRIICKCFCSGKSINMKTSRRGSDMSAIRIRARTPSITPSAAAHSFGDESELHHSEMSSNDR
ncbi:octopamine receptor Oamb isoform X2 [Lucilia cuprina]|uniref:octopamine receptor Oamb isoform X2 n=1 Tax=Lucilia cuprina TaxID=7375 RepID=UPI001F0641E2|nr:octopamine receptor Oamb isoform X2 [Lucilia cuprina]